jgi:hypothetical protein
MELYFFILLMLILVMIFYAMFPRTAGRTYTITYNGPINEETVKYFKEIIKKN